MHMTCNHNRSLCHSLPRTEMHIPGAVYHWRYEAQARMAFRGPRLHHSSSVLRPRVAACPTLTFLGLGGIPDDRHWCGMRNTCVVLAVEDQIRTSTKRDFGGYSHRACRSCLPCARGTQSYELWWLQAHTRERVAIWLMIYTDSQLIQLVHCCSIAIDINTPRSRPASCPARTPGSEGCAGNVQSASD